MQFPGHETVSIGDRVRVYAALNKVIIISILLSLMMITAFYILPSKSCEKTVNTMSTLKRYLANAMRYGGQFKMGLTGLHD